MTPIVDGSIHHFGATGLSNALAVLGDEETWSSWDHITGEAFDGPLAGRRLPWWGITMTTAQAARVEQPDLRVLISDFRSLASRVIGAASGNRIGGRGFIPPGMGLTMHAPPDPRLPKLTQGLGVIDGEAARFYPMAALMHGPVRDRWNDRTLVVTRGELDGVPRARWEDGTEPAMQLLSRWYGFSFTWPDCTVLEQGTEPA
ncbi:MAG: DUF3179 domain-containing protein [Myxococcales bacterium]|nr:DUF3179 domain-containing protein [Myxococcales bacterium]